MAPLTNEPDAIRVVLPIAHRRIYYTLILQIMAYMRSQLEIHHSPEGSPDQSSSTRSPPSYSGNGGDAPLFEPRSRDKDNTTPPAQPPRPRKTPPSPALLKLRREALVHFDGWRDETIQKLREVIKKPDEQKVLDARRKRAEQLSTKKTEEPAYGEDLLSFGDDSRFSKTTAESSTGDTGPTSLAAFQNLYHPIPTRLSTIPLEDRKEVLSAMLILLLSVGNYSAYSRTLVCYLVSALEIPPKFLNSEETEIATTMVEAAQKAEQNGTNMTAEAEAAKRREQNKVGRFWKVGLASVAGAAIIGVTGGLAAPAVAGVIGGLMGSVGLGGLASFLGIFWMNSALVGGMCRTLFGAFGAKMTGEAVDQYAKDVEDFKFLPLREEWGEGWSSEDAAAAAAASRRLRVTIGINGWLTAEEDITKPWRALGDETEVFALRYEMKSLMALGEKLNGYVSSAAWGAVRAQILQRTVLATLTGALWPIFLLNSASNLDNPFSLARNRSEKAGQILADALINKVQGERPVTLVGYSLGARVIYACLRSLADRKAFGLVENVVLIGAPVPSNTVHWQMMRTVVSGKLFNVYSENDYILGFLYRTTSMQLGIAGLQAIDGDIEGVENLDLSNEVTGHLRYPGLTAKILTGCGFPDVRGGAGAIEKDEGKIEIEMRDRDWAETGNLIDVDDKPPVSSKHQNEKFDPAIKNIMEQKTDASVRDDKLDGMSDIHKHDTPSTRTSSLPELDQTARPGFSLTSSKTEPTTTTTTSKSVGASKVETPPPAYSVSEIETTGHDDDYAYDSEEEGFGIKMVDNDSDGGELTFIEPLRIDD